MSDPVHLLVPTDGRFRAIGPELAGKYCLVQGGSDTDAAALAVAVTGAVNHLSTQAGDEADLAIDFRAPGGQVEVAMRCGGQSSVVKHPLPST